VICYYLWMNAEIDIIMSTDKKNDKSRPGNQNVVIPYFSNYGDWYPDQIKGKERVKIMHFILYTQGQIRMIFWQPLLSYTIANKIRIDMAL